MHYNSQQNNQQSSLNYVREVTLIGLFDIWYSTNQHHGPCASNATDIVAETQTAGANFPADHDRRHISTSGTAKTAASSLRLKVNGKLRRSLPLNGTCNPWFHFRNTICRGQTFQPTTTYGIFPLPVPRNTPPKCPSCKTDQVKRKQFRNRSVDALLSDSSFFSNYQWR